MRTVVGRAALGYVDLVIALGASNAFSFRYLTSEGEAPAEPVDLTGWSAAAQVRRSSGADLVLDLTPYIALGADGTVAIDIPHTATANLSSSSSAVWDLELTDPDGRVIRFLQGRASLSAQVTR